jgi:hypothetical protein
VLNLAPKTTLFTYYAPVPEVAECTTGTVHHPHLHPQCEVVFTGKGLVVVPGVSAVRFTALLPPAPPPPPSLSASDAAATAASAGQVADGEDGGGASLRDGLRVEVACRMKSKGGGGKVVCETPDFGEGQLSVRVDLFLDGLRLVQESEDSGMGGGEGTSKGGGDGGTAVRKQIQATSPFSRDSLLALPQEPTFSTTIMYRGTIVESAPSSDIDPDEVELDEEGNPIPKVLDGEVAMGA